MATASLDSAVSFSLTIVASAIVGLTLLSEAKETQKHGEAKRQKPAHQTTPKNDNDAEEGMKVEKALAGTGDVWNFGSDGGELSCTQIILVRLTKPSTGPCSYSTPIPKSQGTGSTPASNVHLHQLVRTPGLLYRCKWHQDQQRPLQRGLSGSGKAMSVGVLEKKREYTLALSNFARSISFQDQLRSATALNSEISGGTIRKDGPG
ncbi:hypothetical protein BKA70DRAFT_1239694 [Coprinopsis sp. MPI-PUGE-AT-0042]|nr:hypothetical protein BKA70DRAFT_1239694 [Coprinopsis sp. MPI-PUGE-AT-0042]